MFRKMLSFVGLWLIVVGSVLAVPGVDAYADESACETVVSEVFIAPFYSDIITENALNEQPHSQIPSGIRQKRASAYERQYTSIADAGQYVRGLMKNRQETVSFGVDITSDDSDWRAFIYSIYNEALSHTGEPEEGDYIRHQMLGFRATAKGHSEPEEDERMHFVGNLTYTFTYITNEEQEEQINDKLGLIMDSLSLDSMDDYGKAESIYQYITNHVDYDNENDGNTMRHSVYNALFASKAKCQGYAVLFYRMALMAGLDSRVVTGTSFGGRHAWDLVRIDGHYYQVDPTWDNHKSEDEWTYFLKGKNHFNNHNRDLEYQEDTFTSTYPVSDDDYHRVVAVESINIADDRNEINLKIGETTTLHVNVIPDNADNQAVTYTIQAESEEGKHSNQNDQDGGTSSGEENSVPVIAVEQAENSKDYVITAVGSGRAVIEFTSEDGGYNAICEVEVKEDKEKESEEKTDNNSNGEPDQQQTEMDEKDEKINGNPEENMDAEPKMEKNTTVNDDADEKAVSYKHRKNRKVCDHEYHWVIISQASDSVDARMAYECVKCGSVACYKNLENSAYLKFNQDVVNTIRYAREGQQVLVRTDRWISFSRMVAEELDHRPDVSVRLEYTYKGKRHVVLIPAKSGIIGQKSLTDQLNTEGYVGFMYLLQVYGELPALHTNQACASE